MRFSILSGLVVTLVVGLSTFFWLRRPHEPHVESPSNVAGWFEDRAEATGLAFVHHDPATSQHQIIETIGSGLGWIDYDGDGWPDLICLQSGTIPPAADIGKTHRFFRNNRDGTFQDVTEAVGLNRTEFGQGCAVGDYDNDGFDDLAITSFGSLALFHNVAAPNAPGGRRFVDITPASQLTNPNWGTSCAWGDLDGDGLLDLYVCNYVAHDPAQPLLCRDEAKNVPFACNPSAFPKSHHRLFRNRGDGKFEDVSKTAGLLDVEPAAGLAVAILDLDDDRRPDIYVANDLGHAYLFHNLGGMKFEEIALRTGTALGPGGMRMSGMGIEAADFDGSGRPSLFVTNFQGHPNATFFNRGKLRFDDATFQSGLGGPSLDRLAFGVCVLDANLDGLPDLAVANGHVQRFSREAFGVPYAQASQLFLGLGGGKFRDTSESCGVDFLRPRVGRGLARTDYDNDGRPDLALSGVGERVSLFRNRIETANDWIGLELIGDGKASNRNAIGAEMLVEWSGGKCRHFCIGGGSYLSANDRRFTLGLGTAKKLDTVTVRWPSGKSQAFSNVSGGQYWKLTEGRPEPSPSLPK